MYCRFETAGGNIYYLECPGTRLTEACQHLYDVYGAMPLKQATKIDVAKYVKDLLAACGPVGRTGIMRELILQAPGVDKENVAAVADGVIAEMLAAKTIEFLDDDEYPSYDLV